ncbi:hypothetical protein AB0H23_29035 [Streptomyces albogriseolus]|uniref:hypothetical protein n=1 Tax=Streptomyces albogriseolus TaxID=1887 RepID=UPI00345F2EA5
MSGRPDSDLPPDTQTTPEPTEDTPEDLPEDFPDDLPEAEDEDLLLEQARRARWGSVGTGALLALAGTAATVLRAADAAPALVLAAYACGAAVCALAAVLGARGRTRRALWTTVAGVMVMALGDHFD